MRGRKGREGGGVGGVTGRGFLLFYRSLQGREKKFIR